MDKFPKFKGRDVDGNWHYGSLIHDTSTNKEGKEFDICFIVPSAPCMSQSDDFWTARMWRVAPDTVCAFTGQVDRSGNEIYEGDIVRSDKYPFSDLDDENDQQKDNYYGVVFSDEYLGERSNEVMQFVSKQSTRNGISNFINKSFGSEVCGADFEIIGTIYDKTDIFRDSYESIYNWFIGKGYYDAEEEEEE